MSRLLIAGLSAFAFAAAAAEPKVEIDPNTKIEGGADVRSSGANAGAGVQPTDIKEQKPAERAQDKGSDDKDKPISERKPQEREPENASKGGTRPDR